MANVETAQRRRYIRRRVLKRGVLKIDGCDGEFPGLVRDMSEGGVRFVLDDPSSVPLKLRLPVPARLDLGSVHNLACDIVRNAEPSLGISFPAPTPIALSTAVSFEEFCGLLEKLPAVIEHFRALDLNGFARHVRDADYFHNKDLAVSVRELADAYGRIRCMLDELARFHSGAKAGSSSASSNQIR